MIIGIDASRANHEQKTGVESYAYFVIEALKKLETVPTVVGIPIDIGRNWKLENLKFVLYSDTPLQGELAKLPEHWESKVLRWPPRRLWTQIRLSVEMLLHRPDVLFIPAHVFPIIHPKKTVMTIHDVAAFRFPQSYHWFERWYSLWSARFAMKYLWKIIVPSNFTKKELTTAYGRQSTDKIIVIPHGYDKEKYKQINDEKKIAEILQKYGVKKPFILSIGRLEEKKNTWRIIEAFDIFRERYQISDIRYQLVLIGKPGYGYERVREAIEKSPFKSDIIAPGWVEEEDIPYLMNATDVFLFPSLYEGFGLPLLEAFACGVPVVASRGSSLQEVGGKAAVYVDRQDIDDIAKALQHMIENGSSKEEKTHLGLERATQYSWAECAKQTMEVLFCL